MRKYDSRNQAFTEPDDRTYIYDNPAWPKFTWDKQAIDAKLAGAQAIADRFMDELPKYSPEIYKKIRLDNTTTEAVKSNLIEGEVSSFENTLQIVARHLRIKLDEVYKIDPKPEGVVKILLDARQNYRDSMGTARLLRWHKWLFPEDVEGRNPVKGGHLRTDDVYVVDAKYFYNNIVYKAPGPEKVGPMLDELVGWINKDIMTPEVIKGAIAHLWFVAVHPFADGNGRIARGLVAMMQARHNRSDCCLYSMSNQFEKKSKGYYDNLMITSKRSIDITPWLDYYIGCYKDAVIHSRELFNVLAKKALFYNTFPEITDLRLKRFVNVLLEKNEGGISEKRLKKITGYSDSDATKVIDTWTQQGVIGYIQNLRQNHSVQRA